MVRDNSMVKDNSIKRMVVTLSFLEAALQLIVFMALTIALYFGLVESQYLRFEILIYVAVIVCSGYLARKKVGNFWLFLLLHVLMIAVGIGIAKDEYSLIFGVVISVFFTAYSIRLKNIAIQRSDISNMPMTKEWEDEVAKEAALRSMVAGEQVPLVFVLIMIVGYFIGTEKGRVMVVTSEAVLCIAFVLLQLVFRNVRKMFEMYSLNMKKNDFPARQIRKVNVFINVAVILLVLLGMLLFYNGQYGNLFVWMKQGVLLVIRTLGRLFFFLLGLFGNDDGGGYILETEQTTTETEETATWEQYESSQLLEAAAEAFVMILIAAAVIGIVWMFRNYVKHFNSSGKSGSDYIEFVSVTAGNDSDTVYDRQNKEKFSREEKSVRKLYKKRVKRGAGGKPLDPASTPTKLTFDNITKDDETGREITEIYEKARYSKEHISAEEIAKMKSL